MTSKTMKTLLLFTVCLLFLFVLSPIAGAEEIYDSVIRIHILADSDEAEDQERKLLVRDALLQFSQEKFSLCKTRENAKTEVLFYMNDMKRIAEDVLRKTGCEDEVNLFLSEEYYPTRHYENLSLPGGKYLSLQVKIGEASGQNWWCVLFPPVCLNSAKKAEDALLDAGMEEEAVKTVTVNEEQYQIRFRIVELWNEAKQRISRVFSR